MIDVAMKPVEKALVALCGLCGLRVGEAISALRGDLVYNGTWSIEVRGKGDKRRVVPISERAWKFIDPIQCERGPAERLVPMADRTARDVITRLGCWAGVSRPVSSHDLRATFATEVYTATKDIRAVQKLLGHSSIETTQGYVNVAEDTLRAAVNL